MNLHPGSRRSQVMDILCELHDRYLLPFQLGPNSFIVASPLIDQLRSWPMREIRDLLENEGLITLTKAGSIALTAKGFDEVERIAQEKLMRIELDSPYPTTREEIAAELDHWMRWRQGAEPGSIHWEQATGRIEHLRFLDQRMAEQDRLYALKTATTGDKIYGNKYVDSQHAEGPNARVVIGNDLSENVYGPDAAQLFALVRHLISEHVTQESARDDLSSCLDELEAARSREGAYEKYSRFVALAAAHTTLLAALAAHLPQLISWIDKLGALIK